MAQCGTQRFGHVMNFLRTALWGAAGVRMRAHILASNAELAASVARNQCGVTEGMS